MLWSKTVPGTPQSAVVASLGVSACQQHDGPWKQGEVFPDKAQSSSRLGEWRKICVCS